MTKMDIQNLQPDDFVAVEEQDDCEGCYFSSSNVVCSISMEECHILVEKLNARHGNCTEYHHIYILAQTDKQ